MANNSEFLQKLKDHLKELFQFGSSDLDFGIYRIMNYKREEIENFIERDLIRAVEKEFEKYKTQSNKKLTDKLQKVENKIKEDFGSDILHNGKLIEKYGETKIVKECLELKKQVEEIDLTESVQEQVFNDLYNFFSRYYEDGDFISKKRYSGKQHKYAIPYSGEEVKLYWANYDQYYVKTGETFKDYEFNQKGHRFIFRTIIVDVPAGNVKGDRRYFMLSEDEPIKLENKTCIINFEYRPLTEGDLKKYPVKTKDGKARETGIKQDELNPILKDKILSAIKPIELKAILGEIATSSARNDKDKTVIEKHLLKFTRKITSDFFIHKDLKGFLERELDYFIKTEVLDIESFDTEKERYFDKHLTRAKVVKNIGRRIIEFLSQIEEFQKMLWEKKKFVLKTEYVITTDRIPGEFYEEIIKNKEQLKEWEELGFEVPSLSSLRGTKFRSNLKLPVDTKYFAQEFKERLIERLSEKDNLDALIDGVLIKSENWQALNLLLEKYKEKVQCIYIDPPFNKENEADYLYKVGYKDSTWITMIINSIGLEKKLMNDKGSIFVRCDYNGNWLVRSLMNIIFGSENFRNDIAVKRTMTLKGESGRFHTACETLYFYGKTEKIIFNGFRKLKPESEWEWVDMHLPGSRKDKELLYRIFFGKKIKAPEGRRWTLSQEALEDAISKGLVKMDEKTGMPKFLTKWETLGSNWTDISGYSPSWDFTTENSELLLQRVIESTSNESDFVMDFFLGSGTTTAVAHKLNRKWLGIEMGDHFETVVLPRMKKVLFYDKSEISKKVKDYKGGGFFKYHYFEQYEDTLHNIDFPQEDKGQKLLELLPESGKTEYLMKYILKFETEGSPSILDIKQFENPFEYKLRVLSLPNTLTLNEVRGLKEGILRSAQNDPSGQIVNVDLVETFNYLIGLKINKYKFVQENGRKYVFVFGERNSRKTAIVWRPTKGMDLTKDKEVIDSGLNKYASDEIFINGDSFIKGYKLIESEFKALVEVMK